MQQQVILAYSGGLDTSVILKWLINQGYDVTAFIADVGQNEDFAMAEEKAICIGAKKVIIEDCKEEFISNYIYPSLQSGALYENRYLLGTSLARPLIAKKIIEYAKRNGITHIAHGATGKGNDQIRFELVFMQFMPNVTVIAPWKDPKFLAKFKGRTDLLNYANEHAIPVTSSLQKPYSIDENLMHVSYEAGILEDPSLMPPAEMFQKTLSPQNAPDKTLELSIEFLNGVPVKIIEKSNQNVIEGDPLIIFNYLNQVGGQNAIGRIDIVESRFVGMKSRGVYETPAGTILHKAYQDLETLVLDREVILLKSCLAPKIAQLIYNGFWFSPEMKMLMASNQQIISKLNGIVNLGLYKGNIIIYGRTSPNSLYDHDIASMDKLGDYDQTDAKGFIKLNALRFKKTAGLIIIKTKEYFMSLAYLTLYNNQKFIGQIYNYNGLPINGEVVFNTGMTGYEETLTDPSYAGQILVFTYPLLGNYGVGDQKWWESSQIHVKAIVCNSLIEHQGHYQCLQSLSNWARHQNIPLLTRVDTRALTKVLSDNGTMLGGIHYPSQNLFLEQNIEPSISLIQTVTCKNINYHGHGKYKIILVDFGVKQNIIRSLLKFDVTIKQVPYNYDYSQDDYDGILLSNGPGDPKSLIENINILQSALKNNKPIFGICLGSQLLALASGADTYKLKFGHRGQNQPCQDLMTKRCYLTSQNHGYAICQNSFPDDWEITFKHLHDGSIAGIRHKNKLYSAVQFHPEAAAGPHDTEYLFSEFINQVKYKACEK